MSVSVTFTACSDRQHAECPVIVRGRRCACECHGTKARPVVMLQETHNRLYPCATILDLDAWTEARR